MHPASPDETLAIKVILGHVVAEVAKANERAGGDAAAWIMELEGRVARDIAITSSVNVSFGENRLLQAKALAVAGRFFQRCRAITTALSKAA